MALEDQINDISSLNKAIVGFYRDTMQKMLLFFVSILKKTHTATSENSVIIYPYFRMPPFTAFILAAEACVHVGMKSRL